MNIIGFIGSGNISTQVARLAVDAGMKVLLSNSRGPETLKEKITELGDAAQAVTVAEAATQADIVVVAIPFFAYKDLNPQDFVGKIVIETTNYYAFRDGDMPKELEDSTLTTSEIIQRHLKDAKVVKAFNSIYTAQIYPLARPSSASDRSALPLASDSQEAKDQVIGLLDKLGFDAVDAGTLADTWRMAPGEPVYVTPYRALDDISKIDVDPGQPASIDKITELLHSAVRN